jgi:oligopeptide/dipeptide ABC transporter ATP-binding protein
LASSSILLEVKNLKQYFPARKAGFWRKPGHVRAVDGVDFHVMEGETLGLVGESGCGKTTVARAILRLDEPTGGTITFRCRGHDAIEIRTAPPNQLKALRRGIQLIFQDPYSSLNPRMTVGELIGEPLLVHGLASGSELKERVHGLLKAVGLSAEHMRRYPHEFSGGQRQRIGIARALALRPQLVVADEPVSALDVSIQAQVINLLEDLQKEFGLTYLFIAHDLSMVKYISNRVAVMYLGKIVELAETAELFLNPKHPYTEALLSAVPVPDPHYKVKRIRLSGEVPSPINPPSGCTFHPRCAYVQDQCRSVAPPYRALGQEHYVACHLSESLTLQPVYWGQRETLYHDPPPGSC